MNEVLKLEGVSKYYGPQPALAEVSLTLPRGKIIGLLGPNGSGKTTLIKLVAGLLRPSAGEITVCGLPVGEESRAHLSYLPERNSLDLRMSPDEAIAYFADFFPDFDRALAVEMLTRLGVRRDAPIRTLSKGTREKVQLVLVMSRRAELYLLDEPIGGVDPATRDYVLRTISEARSPDSTILICTHLIADVEPILDEYLFLCEGKVLRYDSAEHTRAAEGRSLDQLFREVFRC